ncbi:hypothetical protein ScalyP_jg432 [Parmales sp. scaly parma]|nr:hypothetical protein ScalyP_jg432 [Parmales sp. scaly parma]
MSVTITSLEAMIKALHQIDETLQPLLSYATLRNASETSDELTQQDGKVLLTLALTMQSLMFISVRLDGGKVQASHEIRISMKKIREASEKLKAFAS